MRIDRRRKMHATVLLRALGYSTQELLNYFYSTETVFIEKGGKFAKCIEYDLLAGQRATRDIKIGAEVVVKKNTKFTRAAIKQAEGSEPRSPADRARRARSARSAREDVVDKETGEVLLECNEEVTEVDARAPARSRRRRASRCSSSTASTSAATCATR